MDTIRLLKGFEIELFTGTYESHIGISNEIQKIFPDFVKEPDIRNVEYITEPHKDYQILSSSLAHPRKRLRKWLKERDLTIIPSSTLCFEHDTKFQRSDPQNSYHEFIENSYGTSVATSSVHINLGIEDSEEGETNDCSSGVVLALEGVFTSEISTGLLWLMSFSRSLSGKGEVPNNNFAASSLGFDSTDACISISFESGSAEEPQDAKRTKIARIGRRIIKWGKIAFIGKQLQNCVN